MELVVCCRLMTEAGATMVDDVAALCTAYENGAEADLPIPLELLACLDQIIASSPMPGGWASNCAKRVLAMLEQTGNCAVAGLQNAVERLRRFSSVRDEAPE